MICSIVSCSQKMLRWKIVGTYDLKRPTPPEWISVPSCRALQLAGYLGRCQMIDYHEPAPVDQDALAKVGHIYNWGALGHMRGDVSVCIVD